MTARRYTRSEVDAALTETERNATTPHGQIVLAAEVLALRVQYRSVMRCPAHNSRMAVGARGQFECWRCTEGARLERQVIELTEQLRAVTDCPAGLFERDEHGQAHCRYRWLKQAQVDALQAENDRLRNELAQLRVEFHFLLEGCEPLAACEHEHV